MLDYSREQDLDGFRQQWSGGYLDAYPRESCHWPAHDFIAVTALVEFLLHPSGPGAERELFERLRLTVDGPEPDKIDFAVSIDGALVPLRPWVSGSGLSAFEPVFLHRRFRWVLSDVGESFDLDPGELLEKILPLYRGYLHAWLDRDEVRRGFPGADRRKQNYYAHHVLDWLEHHVRDPASASPELVEARDRLRRQRNHVLRHVLVAKSPAEAAETGAAALVDPYALLEPGLLELLDTLTQRGPPPLLATVGEALLGQMDLAKHASVRLGEPFARLGRRAATLSFGALETTLHGLSNPYWLQGAQAEAFAALVVRLLAQLESGRALAW